MIDVPTPNVRRFPYQLAAGEDIDDAGFVTEATTDALASALNRALAGERPPTDPTRRASRYDWDEITEQAESVYRHAINGQ